MVDQPSIGGGVYPSLRELRNNMTRSGRLVSRIEGDSAAATAGLELVTGPAGSAHFVAVLGWSWEDLMKSAHGLLKAGKIDAILKQKSEHYSLWRSKVMGLFEGAAGAIGNSMFWNTLCAPSNGLIFSEYQPALGKQIWRLGGLQVGLFLRVFVDGS